MAFAELELEGVGLASGFIEDAHFAGLHTVYKVGESQNITNGKIVIIGWVFEGEWQNGIVYEVGLVDTCKALSNNSFYTEVKRCQCCVFAARALAVVVASYNHRGCIGHGLTASWEFCIRWGEAEVCKVRNVGTVWKQLGVTWHDVVGGDVVFKVSSNLTGEDFWYSFAKWHVLDVWTLYKWGVANLVFAREDEEVVVHAVVFGHSYIVKVGIAGWVGEHAVDGTDGSGFWANEINVGAGGTTAAIEVAVEGTERNAVGVWCLTHANARTAATFQNTSAGFEEDGENAVGGHLLEDGAGAWGNNKAHVFCYLVALEHSSAACEVEVGGVGAATNGNLVDLHAFEAGHGHNLIWTVWASGHWF